MRRGTAFLQTGGVSLSLPPDPGFSHLLNRHCKLRKYDHGTWHVAAPDADQALELARSFFALDEVDLREMPVAEIRKRYG